MTLSNLTIKPGVVITPLPSNSNTLKQQRHIADLIWQSVQSDARRAAIEAATQRRLALNNNSIPFR